MQTILTPPILRPLPFCRAIFPWMTALNNRLLAVRGCLGMLGIWLGLACLSLPSLAQTTWTGTTNTDWATPGNWNTGLVPTASSDVVIADAANDPIIGAGTAALANSVEVQPGAVLSLVNTATLTINGSKTFSGYTSAFINQGTVTNSGQLFIGNLASVGQLGLINYGAFNNNTGGTISIDSSTSAGLWNDYGTFTNAASIIIGATASVGTYGLLNNGTFNNNTGGTISIDRSAYIGLWNGLWNAGTTFTNAASIVIGATASTGNYGLWNLAPFANTTGGKIQIDRSTGIGLYNNGTFTNAANIVIGATVSVGTNGLWNQATFANNACATLTLYANLNNEGSFTNDGLFTLNTTQAHTNAALTNNGILAYPQGNPIPNVTNNELIVLPISTSCQRTATPALQIGDLSTFSVGSTWFQDTGLTTPAGTYNANTFTASNLAPAGTYPVYFSVSDPGHGCVRTVSIPVTVNSFPTASITASANPVTAGQSVTLTASGGTQYEWSTGATTPTITVQPSVTTLYAVTVTNAAGCSSPASLNITVLSASIQVAGPAKLCVKAAPPVKTVVTLPLSLTVVGGSSPYSYTWSYKAPTSSNFKAIAAGGTSIGKVKFVPVSGAATLNLIGTKGNLNGLQGYVIRLTVQDNTSTASVETLLDGSCPLASTATARVEAFNPEGIKVAELVQVRVYPNPVAEELQVEISGLSQPAKVALFDLQGRPQGQWSVEPVEGVGRLKAPVTALAEGLYLLQVATAEGVLHWQRVIKQR